jgi:hypothetical protein
MKSLLVRAAIAVVGLTLGIVSSALSAGDLPFPDAPRITKEQVKELIGKPGFYLLDVRPNEQWNAAKLKLPGAIHEDPEEADLWAYKYPKDAKIVTYCA